MSFALGGGAKVEKFEDSSCAIFRFTSLRLLLFPLATIEACSLTGERGIEFCLVCDKTVFC